MYVNPELAGDINVSKIVCYEQKWGENKGYFLYESLPRPDHGLTYILAEYAIYTFADGSRLRAERADIVYVPQGSFYSVVFGAPDENGSSTYLVNFSVDLPLLIKDVRVITRACDKECTNAFAQAVQLYKSHAGRSLALKAAVYRILDILNMDTVLFSGEMPAYMKSPVSEGVRYIEQNIDKLISVSELARLCHMAESTFRREFERVVGVSPLRYINHLKIEKSKEFLVNADYNISDLPETLGFYDLSHFYKTFKSVTGITPSRFRAQLEK